MAERIFKDTGDPNLERCDTPGCLGVYSFLCDYIEYALRRCCAKLCSSCAVEIMGKHFCLSHHGAVSDYKPMEKPE